MGTCTSNVGDSVGASTSGNVVVGVQVLLHEATLRLMTGANPSSHSKFSLRCRRRVTAADSVTSPASLTNSSTHTRTNSAAEADVIGDYHGDSDEDDDDDDDDVIYSRKIVQDCHNIKDN